MIIRDNFCNICTQTYVVTPHLNCLSRAVQMWGNNISFWKKKEELSQGYHQNLTHTKSSVYLHIFQLVSEDDTMLQM